MKIKVEALVIINFLFMLIGIFIGLIIHKKPLPPTVTEKIQDNIKEQVASTDKITNNQNGNEQIASLITQYYPTGHIEKVIKTQTNYVTTSTNNTTTINKNQIDGIITDNTLISPQTPQKNWTLGGFIPTTNYKDYSDYTLQVSYRIVGPILVSLQSNLIFTRPMVGIQIQF